MAIQQKTTFGYTTPKTGRRSSISEEVNAVQVRQIVLIRKHDAVPVLTKLLLEAQLSSGWAVKDDCIKK